MQTGDFTSHKSNTHKHRHKIVFKSQTKKACKIFTLMKEKNLFYILLQRHGYKKHNHQYIKQKIRELSRFLLVARNECDKITDLESCINPTGFSDMISSVKKLCGYESFGNSFQTPSLALKIGTKSESLC